MISIGIDPSLRCTGIVVLINGNLMMDQIIKIKREEDDIRADEIRLISIRKELVDFFEKSFMELQLQDYIIIYEGYSFGSRKRGLPYKLGELGGIIKTYFYETNKKYLVVPPPRWKKFIVGIGNADKTVVEMELFKKYNLDFSKKYKPKDRNNVVDAYGLAKLGEAVLTYKSGDIDKIKKYTKIQIETLKDIIDNGPEEDDEE